MAAMVASVLVAVSPLSLSAQQTQRSADTVLALVGDVTDVTGRLLIGAQHLLDGDDPITVAVGEITYDGVPPALAAIMAASMEDSLVQAATRISLRRTVRVVTGGGTRAPVGASGAADLTVRVQGGSGSSTALFIVQILQADGVILASTQVYVDLDDPLREALAPSTALIAA
jgi:hypothetical protein